MQYSQEPENSGTNLKYQNDPRTNLYLPGKVKDRIVTKGKCRSKNMVIRIKSFEEEKPTCPKFCNSTSE